jgi:membrane associated rhomboid family serine protease
MVLMKKDVKHELSSFWLSLQPVLIFAICLWVIKLFEFLSGVPLGMLGNHPRTVEGLKGIILSPFLHADFRHLMSNTIPLLVLGTATFYFYKNLAYVVVGIIWLGGGVLVWMMARGNYHIGASGLIYGLASFLFFSGIRKRYSPMLGVSMLVILFYGGMIWGLLPIDSSMSWEYHLFSALMGFISAIIFQHQGPQAPVIILSEGPEHNDWEINKDLPPPFKWEE